MLDILKKYKYIILVLLVLCGWWFYIYIYNRSFPSDTGIYKPYVFGHVIDFSEKGDSSKFVDTENGWCAQEPLYRCTVEKDVVTRLYVKNDGHAVQLQVLAAGSFPAPDTYQNVIVYVNGKQIKNWFVSHKKWHGIIIPSSLIADNKIEIQFEITKPFRPTPSDTRNLGMIVYKVKLNKEYGQNTRVQLLDWFRRQLYKIDPSIPKDYSQTMENI